MNLRGLDIRILQAPMAGAQNADLAIATAKGGALGAIPGAMLTPDEMRAELTKFRAAVPGQPINVNFFCHQTPAEDAAAQFAWREKLAPYYAELGIKSARPGASRRPFDADACALVEELRPEVVSFHFGLPDAALMTRVKSAGAFVLASATTVAEARWLEAHGVDAIIAQGFEAGGHRGMFLAMEPAQQVGTFALVPQVVDAVRVPVIAAGGIADPRGVRAAFALGAAAVQIGTAYLFTPEATISPAHRAALEALADDATVLTNVFSGRPARGIVNRIVKELGPISALAPAFPTAGAAIAPLKASPDLAQMWSGQAAALVKRGLDATALTRWLGEG